MRAVYIFIGIIISILSSGSVSSEEIKSDEEIRDAATKIVASSLPTEIRRAVQSYLAAHEIRATVYNTILEPPKNVEGFSWSESREAEAKLVGSLAMEKEKINQLVAIASDLDPKYQQPAFQCLGDYDKCTILDKPIVVCGAIFVVCLAERLVPLAK